MTDMFECTMVVFCTYSNTFVSLNAALLQGHTGQCPARRLQKAQVPQNHALVLKMATQGLNACA